MTLKTTAQIGDAIEGEGGYYAGKIRVGDDIMGIILPPKAIAQFDGIWLPSYKSVPGASSCFDSRANTLAMAEAGSPIAQHALTVEHEGNKDLVIPARDVLEVLYRNLKPTTRENYVYRSGDNPSAVPPTYPYSSEIPAQTTLGLFREGGAEAFDAEWHWSSTQSSEYHAWLQGFDDGLQGTGGEYGELAVRLVRLIPFSA